MIALLKSIISAYVLLESFNLFCLLCRGGGISPKFAILDPPLKLVTAVKFGRYVSPIFHIGSNNVHTLKPGAWFKKIYNMHTQHTIRMYIYTHIQLLRQQVQSKEITTVKCLKENV